MARPAKIRQAGKRLAEYVVVIFFLSSSSSIPLDLKNERGERTNHTHYLLLPYRAQNHERAIPHCTLIGFHFRTINTAGAVRAMIQKMSNGWTWSLSLFFSLSTVVSSWVAGRPDWNMHRVFPFYDARAQQQHSRHSCLLSLFYRLFLLLLLLSFPFDLLSLLYDFFIWFEFFVLQRWRGRCPWGLTVMNSFKRVFYCRIWPIRPHLRPTPPTLFPPLLVRTKFKYNIWHQLGSAVKKKRKKGQLKVSISPPPLAAYLFRLLPPDPRISLQVSRRIDVRACPSLHVISTCHSQKKFVSFALPQDSDLFSLLLLLSLLFSKRRRERWGLNNSRV